MSKIKLEFEEFEERDTAKIAFHYLEMHSALRTIREELRRDIKHTDFTQDQQRLAEIYQERLTEILEDEGILDVIENC